MFDTNVRAYNLSYLCFSLTYLSLSLSYSLPFSLSPFLSSFLPLSLTLDLSSFLSSLANDLLTPFTGEGHPWAVGCRRSDGRRPRSQPSGRCVREREREEKETKREISLNFDTMTGNSLLDCVVFGRVAGSSASSYNLKRLSAYALSFSLLHLICWLVFSSFPQFRITNLFCSLILCSGQGLAGTHAAGQGVSVKVSSGGVDVSISFAGAHQSSSSSSSSSVCALK